MRKEEKKILDETVKKWKRSRGNAETGILDKVSRRLPDGEIKDFFQGLENNVENIFQALGAFENVTLRNRSRHKDKIKNLKNAIDALRKDRIALETCQYPEGIPLEIGETWLGPVGICYMIKVTKNIRARAMTVKEALGEVTEELKDAKDMIPALEILEDISSGLPEGKVRSFFEKLENDMDALFKALDPLQDVPLEELVNYKTEVEKLRKALKTLKEDRERLERGQYPQGVPQEIAKAYFGPEGPYAKIIMVDEDMFEDLEGKRIEVINWPVKI